MEQIQVGDSNCGGGSSRRDGIVLVGAPLRLDTLPEDCITMVISHTSPRDACVVASVSKTVKSAAQSDLVWEKFLSPEYSSLVPRSLNCSSKKEVYLSLADDSLLVDDGKKSFWFEKSSGKKCYMLSAMDLTMTWGDSPAHLQWISVPECKFEKVAELRKVCWFEIRGKISCGMLSKGTNYSVYAVFKRASTRSYGFAQTPLVAGVGFVGKEATKIFVFLEPRRDYDEQDRIARVRLQVRRGFGMRQQMMDLMEFLTEEVKGQKEVVEEKPKERGDGWSEVKLGKFDISNGGCDDGDEIEFTLMETRMRRWKSGLLFQGIEIRPLKEEEIVTK